MTKYRKHIYGIEKVKLASGVTGYLVNIITPTHQRISGGIWEREHDAHSEAKKYIEQLSHIQHNAHVSNKNPILKMGVEGVNWL